MSSVSYASENATLDAAIELATKLYWPVFPVDITIGKHPLSNKGFNGRNWGQTTDVREIKKHFNRFPEDTIGVATGEDSGIFVLDVDSPIGGHAHDGFATLAELEAKYGPLPKTVMADTASGGRHYYFEYPDFPIKNDAGRQLGKGLDIRGDGGYIVVPPSIKSDGETGEIVGAYEWINSPFDTDVAEAPEWLLNLLKPKPRGRPAKPSVVAITAKPDGRISKLLDQLRAAEDGERNDTLNRVAFQIAQYVGDDDDMRGQLYDIATGIGLPDSEALKTINGAMAQGAEQPKEATEFLSISDGALADRVEQAWRDGVRVTEADDWYFWQMDRWKFGKRDRAKGLVESQLRSIADGVRERAKAIGDPKAFETAAKVETMLRSANTVANVFSLAKCRSSLIIDNNKFDRDINLLGIPGGVIDLRTMERRDARPEDYISRQTSVAPVKAPPVKWLEFLNSCFPKNPEKVALLKRVFGYAISGSCKEEKFFFLLGDGRNGKGVTIDTIAKVFGDYARTVDSRIFIETRGEQHPTAMMDLEGPRLAVFNEIGKGKSWNEEFLKQVSGRDGVNARKLFQDPTNFKPRSVLMCSANDAPSLSADSAIRARLVLIEFKESFVGKEDTGLKDRLFEEEGSQILNWCLEGVEEYKAKGLDIPDSVKAASQRYADDNDIIKNYIDECCVTHGPREADDVNGKLVEKSLWDASSVLYADFSDWMIEQGLKPWSAKSFSATLKKKGFVDSRQNGCRGFEGIMKDINRRGQ